MKPVFTAVWLACAPIKNSRMFYFLVHVNTKLLTKQLKCFLFIPELVAKFHSAV